MAGQVVQMDYAVVGDVSSGFGQSAQILRVVSQILSVAIEVLRAMVFASLGTSIALANYLSVIKQKAENLAKVCEEFQNDLARAIGDHKKGDVQGKRYFGEGIGR